MLSAGSPSFVTSLRSGCILQSLLARRAAAVITLSSLATFWLDQEVPLEPSRTWCQSWTQAILGMPYSMCFASISLFICAQEWYVTRIYIWMSKKALSNIYNRTKFHACSDSSCTTSIPAKRHTTVSVCPGLPPRHTHLPSPHTCTDQKCRGITPLEAGFKGWEGLGNK